VGVICSLDYVAGEKMKRILFLSFLAFQLVGCVPEVGSDRWCAWLEEKPKGEWTANEAVAYTKHCIF
jgi:hypothetical protein